MSVAVVLTQDPDLGPACADRLAADGFSVALAPVGLAAEDLEVGPGVTLAAPVDPRAPAAGLQAIAAAWPEVDAVVTVPGWGAPASVLRARSDVVADHLAATAAWPFAAIGTLAPALRGSPAPRVVIVTSVIALRGGAWEAAHGAASAALVGLSRSLARELGPSGITVNAVAAGALATRRFDQVASTKAGRRHVDEVVDRSALGRIGGPADLAGAVAFLASPGAGYVHGALLAVDGGLALGFG